MTLDCVRFTPSSTFPSRETASSQISNALIKEALTELNHYRQYICELISSMFGRKYLVQKRENCAIHVQHIVDMFCTFPKIAIEFNLV